MTVYPEKASDTEFRHFNIHELIKTQNKVISTSLLEVVNKLKEDEMEHRKKYRDNKLADIFPQTLRYHFEKMYESTHRTSPFEIGKINFDVLLKVLEDFVSELKRRGVYEAYEWVKYHLELIDHPIKRLDDYNNCQDA